jgi:hypothetical protein
MASCGYVEMQIFSLLLLEPSMSLNYKSFTCTRKEEQDRGGVKALSSAISFADMILVGDPLRSLSSTTSAKYNSSR